MDSQLYSVSLQSIGFSFQWDGVYAAVFIFHGFRRKGLSVWVFSMLSFLKEDVFPRPVIFVVDTAFFITLLILCAGGL